MSTTSKKICAGVLSLAFIFAVTSQANAQRWRRDRDLSTGQKAAIIGGGAAAGVALGALLGGKKGALIGGVVGGGAGTGYVVLRDRNDDRDRFGRRFGVRGDRYYSSGDRYYSSYRDRDRFSQSRFDRNRFDRNRFDRDRCRR
jgi:hypothetical protein